MVVLKEAITDVRGIVVGHAQDDQALTGCTVIICEKGAVGGVDQRGGAPGTRETDALRPMHLVNQVHAVILSGGSAFGLDAAGGVMKYLEERNIGFDTGVAHVPIVASAVLYDLALGDSTRRPDLAMGYRACVNATSAPPAQGNAGAGTGATVGKILGMKHAMKSGIGTASIDLGAGVIVGAIVAVNAFGDVVDPVNGSIIAGARTINVGPIRIGEPGYFANTMQMLKQQAGRTIMEIASRTNTVIGVVATNARLTVEESNKVAQMAHNGIAKSILPAHTMLDGDTIFSMATCEKKANVNTIGAFAAEAVSMAVVRAVRFAKSAGGLPACE